MRRSGIRQSAFLFSSLILMGTAFVPESRACVALPSGGQLSNRSLFSMRWIESLAGAEQPEGATSSARTGPEAIVGMWIVTFYAGSFSGPNTPVYDRAIQQFFIDGNELMNSSSFPPILGNVCFGAWKQVGPRTFRLRHIGWTFTAANTFEGTARINATITVALSGDAYTGTYTADVIDPNGNVIPGSASKGDLRASRFQVEQ